MKKFIILFFVALISFSHGQLQAGVPSAILPETKPYDQYDTNECYSFSFSEELQQLIYKMHHQFIPLSNEFLIAKKIEGYVDQMMSTDRPEEQVFFQLEGGMPYTSMRVINESGLIPEAVWKPAHPLSTWVIS
jgi:hypothetical protein